MDRIRLCLALFAAGALLACGPGAAPNDPPEEDPPDPWASVPQRFQVTSGEFEIPAFSEAFKCAIVRMDNPDPFFLTRYRATMKPGSHHFNLMYVDASVGPEPGLYEGSCSMELVPTWFAGSQWTEVEEVLPEGTALRIDADVKLLLDIHYVNSNPEPIPGRVDVELGGTYDESGVEELMGVYFNIVNGFEVAPQSTETWAARFEVRPGSKVHLLTSHAHWQNTRFEIFRYREGDDALESIYVSTHPLHPKVLRLDEPLVFGEGEGFEVRCTWTNQLDVPLRNGESGVEDEMCIMAAFYTPDAGLAWRYGVKKGHRVEPSPGG